MIADRLAKSSELSDMYSNGMLAPIADDRLLWLIHLRMQSLKFRSRHCIRYAGHLQHIPRQSGCCEQVTSRQNISDRQHHPVRCNAACSRLVSSKCDLARPQHGKALHARMRGTCCSSALRQSRRTGCCVSFCMDCSSATVTSGTCKTSIVSFVDVTK